MIRPRALFRETMAVPKWPNWIGHFVPKRANFPPQILTHTAAFQILGGKLSRLKCEISVLDQSGQVTIWGFSQSKSSVGQSGQVDFSSVGPKWPSGYLDFSVKKLCWSKVFIIVHYSFCDLATSVHATELFDCEKSQHG